MKRRKFITLLGGAAAWPVAAMAQRATRPVVGYLSGVTEDLSPHWLAAFRKGLGEQGYVEGRDVEILSRYADGQTERLPALASDLVRRPVAVIFAAFNASAVAAKATNTTIPIVFAVGADPVSLGLVASLNRPGSTMTGISFLSTTVVGRSIQMLREAVPGSAVIAALVNPANPNAEPDSLEAQRAARTLGVPIHILHASNADEIDAAFATLAQLRAPALYIDGDTYFGSVMTQLTILSARHAIPALFQNREFLSAGGLMSYGASIPDAYRLAGGYVGRILKGEKPADLPVQQSTRMELAINLRTAKALGLTVPPNLLAIADEVIE